MSAPQTAAAFADVEGTNITAEQWKELTVAERAVAAVVGAARRREFSPEDDAQLVRTLTVAARGEIVPRSQPDTKLFDALWSALGGEGSNDGSLWGVVWDSDCKALSFVPVGAPLLRCTNLWFKPEGRVAVDSNNQPAAAEGAVILWAADFDVAQAITDWCGIDGSGEISSARPA